MSKAISGKQDDVRRLVGALARKPAGGGDPAGMAAHDFHDEHFGRSLGHRGDVERRFARGHRDVLRHGAEARAAIRVRQVVVDGLRHADADHLVAELIADLGHLVSGVHRVVAAVVEEVADVVRLEYFDEALVLGAILLEALELVARGPECARRRVSQSFDSGAGFLAAVDEVFGERADDAVAARIYLVDELRLHRGFDDARGGGVDDRRYAARLSIKRVHGLGFLGGRALAHVCSRLSRDMSRRMFAECEWVWVLWRPFEGVSSIRSRI